MALLSSLTPTPEVYLQSEFDSIFQLVKCDVRRSFAGIFDILSVRSKLLIPGRLITFQAAEKPLQLLTKLIDEFSPPEGRVLDRYAGSMLTSRTSLKTSHDRMALAN